MSVPSSKHLPRARGPLHICVVAVSLLLTFQSSRAWAHGNIDVADFYQGMLHPILHIEHILSILALGFWSGQAKGRGQWLTPLTFTGAVLLGAVLGLCSVELPAAPVVIYASMILLGLLVAARLRLPVAAMVSIAASLGLFHGWAHGNGMLESLDKPVAYVIGIGVALGLLLFYSVQLLVYFRANFIQIAVRIAGSWITAIGLLVLALQTR